jgi:phospholipase/carboxylesterase
VGIHGLGDEPGGFAGVFDEYPGAARIILPRALDPHESGGYWWFSVRARDNDPEGLAQGIANAAEHVAAALRELVRTRPTDGKPVVTGFSQGGMVTFALAVHHPDVVSTAIPVGGMLPPGLLPGKQARSGPRIIALHGDQDAAVPYDAARGAVERLAALGFDATLRTYEGVGHMIPSEMRADLMKLLVAAAGDDAAAAGASTGQ